MKECSSCSQASRRIFCMYFTNKKFMKDLSMLDTLAAGGNKSTSGKFSFGRKKKNSLTLLKNFDKLRLF